MTAAELDAIAPRDAVEWYLEHRRDDTRVATRRKIDSALGIFVDWTQETGITDMRDICGRELMEFKTWRKSETDLTHTVSLNGTLSVLRRFLKFCEAIDAVEPDLHERVPLPNVPEEEAVNEFVPSDSTVERIRSDAWQFAYASRAHVEIELIAEVGLRMGDCRAIDLSDIDHAARRIHLRHRPAAPDEYGTPLKNGPDSERLINVSESLMDVIQDYIDRNRADVKDRYGREPLLTTEQGRVSRGTFRRDFYKFTRPCEYSQECPHDRTQERCEATRSHEASQCPSSFSSHPLRKWAIMRQLDEGLSKEVLTDRADVSVPVLEQHYDQRSEERKSTRRRNALEENLPEYSPT